MASNVLYALFGFSTALLTMDWIAQFRGQFVIGCGVAFGLAIASVWLNSRKQKQRQLVRVMSEYADRNAA